MMDRAVGLRTSSVGSDPEIFFLLVDQFSHLNKAYCSLTRAGDTVYTNSRPSDYLYWVPVRTVQIQYTVLVQVQYRYPNPVIPTAHISVHKQTYIGRLQVATSTVEVQYLYSGSILALN